MSEVDDWDGRGMTSLVVEGLPMYGPDADRRCREVATVFAAELAFAFRKVFEMSHLLVLIGGNMGASVDRPLSSTGN